jgi:hypothetical protein
MSDINYTYEIIHVDEGSRCMEIVYRSDTYGVMHVGARLPFDGEPLEQVISIFSPVAEWRLRDLAVSPPPQGATGSMTDSIPTVPLDVQVRVARDGLLSASDWTQVSDAPVDKAAWAAYRQALRDIPQQAGFPENVTWPITP